MSKFKIPLGACLTAMLILGIAGATVAQAARPIQPQYTRQGSTIAENLKIRDKSQPSRLWAPSLGIVIQCSTDTSEGTIGPKGLSNGVVKYHECKVFEATKNTVAQGEQFEEGAELAHCTVQSPGEAVGQITTNRLKNHLVWQKGVNKILVLYTPEVGTTFVELEVKESGGACLAKGTFPVTGSILAAPTRVNEEAVMGVQVFDVKNEKAKVTPLFTEWEVEEKGVKETGTASLKLSAKETAFEGMDQIELEPIGGKRGLGAIHE